MTIGSPTATICRSLGFCLIRNVEPEEREVRLEPAAIAGIEESSAIVFPLIKTVRHDRAVLARNSPLSASSLAISATDASAMRPEVPCRIATF